MNFYQLIHRQDPERTALVEDGIAYTYGALDVAALQKRRELRNKHEMQQRHLFAIREKTIRQQLIAFLAASSVDAVPVIVPADSSANPELCEGQEAPKHACMAVLTSGSSGVPKLLYRRYESWADYFPIQNEIFGVNEHTRMFVQGSLAFTGNLNLYLAVFSAGGAVIAENSVNPRIWEKRILEHDVNAVYLIPSKLRLLAKLAQMQNVRRTILCDDRRHQMGCMSVRNIIAGSESMGLEDVRRLKAGFPLAEVTLYYGASELNYVTYVTDRDMGMDPGLVGKPFPGVSVFVENGEIFVDTPYHAEGVTCPCSLSDTGWRDEAGNLYFTGRSDDLVNLHGRKISTVKIRRVLESIDHVKEAAVIPLERPQGQRVYGFVVLEDAGLNMDGSASAGECSTRSEGAIADEILATLRGKLDHHEIPSRIIVLDALPRNESGKVDLRCLEARMVSGADREMKNVLPI